MKVDRASFLAIVFLGLFVVLYLLPDQWLHDTLGWAHFLPGTNGTSLLCLVLSFVFWAVHVTFDVPGLFSKES